MNQSITDLGLSDPSRLFRLREWHHMSHQEVSEWFGISERVVRRQYERHEISSSQLDSQVGQLAASFTDHIVRADKLNWLEGGNILRNSSKLGELMVELDMTCREVAYFIECPEYLVRMWADIHDLPRYHPPNPSNFDQFNRKDWMDRQPPESFHDHLSRVA